MTPNFGPGGCPGIQDALVLARCLTGGANVAAALRGSESERVARTKPISRRSGALAQIANPLACRHRNCLAAYVPRRIMLRELEAQVAYTGHLR